MAFKKQLVTSCKQAIWGEILGGNAPNYALRLCWYPASRKIVSLIPTDATVTCTRRTVG